MGKGKGKGWIGWDTMGGKGNGNGKGKWRRGTCCCYVCIAMISDDGENGKEGWCIDGWVGLGWPWLDSWPGAAGW